MTDGPSDHPSPVLSGARVRLIPVDAAHVAELRRILAEPAVRRWWGDEAAAADWPFDDPSAVRFAVVVEGRVGGRGARRPSPDRVRSHRR